MQEVENVEAPLSPSSDCHSGIQLSSLCDVEPSSVPANCASLIVSVATDVDNNCSVAVSSSNALLTSHIDTGCVVASLAGCESVPENITPTFTNCLRVEDSDADKKSASSRIDTALSQDEHGLLPASDTLVTSADLETPVTPANTATVDS